MGGGGLIQGGMCLMLWPRGWTLIWGGGGMCFLKSERLFDEIQYILA